MIDQPSSEAMHPSGDDFLLRIDEGFTSVHARRSLRRGLSRPRPLETERPPSAEAQPADVELYGHTIFDRFHWIEAFIAVQFLWGALLFLPGAQQYRGYIRALPYSASLGMLGFYALRRTRGPLPRGSGLVIAALLLLVLNLLHPSSQLSAGIAQCVFQLSIAAPLFWSYKATRSPKFVERLLVLIFVMNSVSAALGVLQVYFPDQFMPTELNSLGMEMNQYYVAGLTYIGNDGRLIIRPPGLTDQPGAAATAGALAAIVGFGLLIRRRSPVQILGILAAITIGFAAIYLSQVRSTLLASIGAGALMSAVALWRGRFAGATGILLAGSAVVVASFIWASSLGGESVSNRFGALQGSGALEAYRSYRGAFVSQTVGELLDEYPLGAGVGRWGMMNTYFGSQTEYGSAPIYVEIQLTGWLLDGGVLMWLLYGGAALLSMWMAFGLTDARNRRLAECAIVVLGVNAYILALAMSSPVFNTQLGLLFWTLAAALDGARSEPLPEDQTPT
jgi:hypothetical protein